jgi:glutamyl-tRNA synthetase
MPGVLGFLFAADASLEYDAKAEKNARKHSERVAELSAYHEHLHPMIELGVDAEVLRDDAKAWVAERNLKFPQLFQPLRCALTGAAGGPDLFSVMALLGPEASLARLAAGIERLA